MSFHLVYFLSCSDDSLALNTERLVISILRQIQKGKVNSLVELEEQSVAHLKGVSREKKELIIDFSKTLLSFGEKV
jgi:hypothetical protein